MCPVGMQEIVISLNSRMVTDEDTVIYVVSADADVLCERERRADSQ